MKQQQNPEAYMKQKEAIEGVISSYITDNSMDQKKVSNLINDCTSELETMGWNVKVIVKPNKVRVKITLS